MPFNLFRWRKIPLVGGAKHKKKARQTATLVGEGILGFLGHGNEGEVQKVVLELESRKGTRKRITLARKVFHPTGSIGAARNPKRHFEIMRNLIEVNRTQRLGLRLPTTFRINPWAYLHTGIDAYTHKKIPFIDRDTYAKYGKPTLYMTYFDKPPALKECELFHSYSMEIPEELRVEADRELATFKADIEWQKEKALQHGFLIQEQAFTPALDPKTKKVIAVIIDAGSIDRKSKSLLNHIKELWKRVRIK